MVLLLSTGCTCVSAGEDGAKFDLDHWAPVGLGGVSATTTKYGLAGWGHRAPVYDSRMKVHRYLWKFNSDRPEAPLPQAKTHRYEGRLRCLEGDFFPALGHIYRAASSEPLSRDGTETAASAARIDREKTPKELLPSLDRYVFTPDGEHASTRRATGSASGLHGQMFVIPAIKTDEHGEPVAVVQFGKGRGHASVLWDFDILPPREVRVGEVLRFGDKSHRVTRIVPSRESVTIDGKEGYLLGWIELAPVPIEHQAPKEITNSMGMKLRLIPAGEFLMGSPPGEEGRFENEGPQHGVRITRPFYLGVTEVTQAQYERVMHENPSYFKGDPERPVDRVSWEDAVEFCRRLSRMEGRPYRLPTEAEWEYACRAGTTTRYFWGQSDAESVMKDYCWYEKNAEECNWTQPHASQEGTQPVGRKRPNAWGLYDMSGNVSEWCADRYENDYYRNWPADEPAGPTPRWPRVIRGGSWTEGAKYCRSAYRTDVRPQNHVAGFRVASPLEASGK